MVAKYRCRWTTIWEQQKTKGQRKSSLIEDGGDCKNSILWVLRGRSGCCLVLMHHRTCFQSALCIHLPCQEIPLMCCEGRKNRAVDPVRRPGNGGKDRITTRDHAHHSYSARFIGKRGSRVSGGRMGIRETKQGEEGIKTRLLIKHFHQKVWNR